jgi:hypothetical protein
VGRSSGPTSLSNVYTAKGQKGTGEATERSDGNLYAHISDYTKGRTKRTDGF